MNHDEVIGLYAASNHFDVCHARRTRGRLAFDHHRMSLELGESPVPSLRRASTEHGWLGLPCVIGIRGDSVVLRSYRVPEGESSEDMLERKSADFTDLAPEQMIVGSRRMQDEHGTLMLMAIVRREIAERLCEQARAAGLRPVAVVPSSVAIYNAATRFLAPPRKGEALACLDVEEHYSDLVLGRNDCLHFARGIQAGAIDLQNEQSKGNWAQKLGGLRDLLGEDERIPPLGTVALSGLQEPFDVDIPAMATSSLQGLVLPADELARGYDAVPPLAATGLAMAGSGEAPVQINLHPDGPTRAPSGAWPWFVAAGILAASLLLCFVLLRGKRGQLERGADSAQAELASLGQLQAAGEGERLRIAEIDQLLGPLESGITNRQRVHDVLVAVESAKASNDWIVLIADNKSYFRDAGNAATTRVPGPFAQDESARDPYAPFASLVIEGYTPSEDLSSIRAMIDRMKQHPAIHQVDLLGDDLLRASSERDAKWASTSSTLFAVEITLDAQLADPEPSAAGGTP